MIEIGKTYRTRDGKKAEVYKIEKMAYDGVLLANFNTEDGGNFVVYADTGRGNGIHGDDHYADLIAEWQDEPKKEISDMSEVKFKVGDWITRPIDGWNEEGYQITKIDDTHVWVKPDSEYASEESYQYGLNQTRDRWFLVKSAADASVPEIGTKWVFNDGQDFVVRVVGFNDKGQIVLEVLSDKNFDVFGALKTGRFEFIEAGSYFTFENEPEKFGEFYKPWVEKPKSLVGYVSVVKEIGTGRLDFDGSVFDTEQEARDGFDSWDGAWELVDVVKVEWEQP